MLITFFYSRDGFKWSYFLFIPIHLYLSLRYKKVILTSNPWLHWKIMPGVLFSQIHLYASRDSLEYVFHLNCQPIPLNRIYTTETALPRLHKQNLPRDFPRHIKTPQNLANETNLEFIKRIKTERASWLSIKISCWIKVS